MGIAAYNDECRKIVMRYAGDWEEIIGRMGRWIGECRHSQTSFVTRKITRYFRFQERLQNTLPMVHGIGVVGF